MASVAMSVRRPRLEARRELHSSIGLVILMSVLLVTLLGTHVSAGAAVLCGTCSAGEYHNNTGGSGVCFPCDAGFECLGGCNAPAACGTGYWQASTGQSSCDVCLRGNECSTTAMWACEAGQHAKMEPSTGCSNCTAGRYTATSGKPNCQACAAGKYVSKEGKTQCELCPAGFQCSDASVEPVPCDTGFYSLGGLVSSCTKCADGYECTTSTQTICPNGTYSNDPTAACQNCNAGTYAPQEGMATCLACPTGTYSAAGADSCELCPAGFFCRDAASAPQACPAGWYSAGGEIKSCTKCPSGTLASTNQDYCVDCPAGYQCSTGVAVQCTDGYYSTGGQVVSCTGCERGFSCNATNGYTQPIPCHQSWYQNQPLQSSCLQCPAGRECPDPSKNPIRCRTNTYSLLGDYLCYPCPSGKNCSLPDAEPTDCPSGTYHVSGSILNDSNVYSFNEGCTQCPANWFCPLTSELPIPCPTGTTSLAGAVNCTECPAGYDCSVPGAQTLCPSGHYSPAGFTSCIECPAGMYCASNAGLPKACPPGKYSAGTATHCTGCPAGSYCPNTAQAAVYPCQPGSYSLGNVSYCTPCPAGQACKFTNESTMTACASGTFAVGGQTACTNCSRGWQCPLTDGTANRPCAPGSFATGGKTKCTVCSPGYYCPDTTMRTMVECDNGTYSIGNASLACIDCPAGMACPSKKRAPTITDICASGFYSTGKQMACYECPAGFACPDPMSDRRIPCMNGTWSTAASAYCLDCDAGYYCNRTAITLCANGTYSAAGQTKCKACPAGYHCIDPSAPTLCPAGSWSGHGMPECRLCDDGYDCTEGATQKRPPQDICPKGYYCNRGTPAIVTACPAGTRGNGTGGYSLGSACVQCSPGKYCSGTASVTEASCLPGYFCNGTLNACPAGYYNPNPEEALQSACLACPAGYYCPRGSDNPVMCPEGYFCQPLTQGFADGNPPTGCPAGTHGQGVVGAKSSARCYACPVGNYCPLASTMPTPCSPGTFNANLNGTDVRACQNCTAGRSCPVSGLHHPSTNCSEGHYCPLGTVYPYDNPCPAGTYTDRHDLSDIGQCETCPPGFTCLVGTGGDQFPLQKCAPGHYCPAGTQFDTQYPCPPGYYSPFTNLVSAAGCIQCPEGKYCAGGDSAISGDCQKGYYCPTASTQADQIACPAGTFSGQANNSHEYDCEACPLGFYCDGADPRPNSCQPGSYNNILRQENAACITCDAGYTCATENMTEPTLCGYGKYSAAGESNGSCPICPAGYYCDSTSTTEAEKDANECPAGLYCPNRLGRIPDHNTHACSPGHYCPKATPTEIVCDAGSYQPNYGAKNQSQCLTCPAGYYCESGSSAVTGDCAEGFYCEAGSTIAQQASCPKGYYQPDLNAESLDFCVTCPAGYYCPLRNMSAPLDCPHGAYCVEGSVSFEDCPAGTFGNGTRLRDAGSCTDCSPGYYCDTVGLKKPSGLCLPGFYCAGGADNSMGVGLETGGVCPAGGYCPEGSAKSTACPAGRFSNATGLQNATQCAMCTPGYYCAGSSNNFPTGQCDAGFYCESGSDSQVQYRTPPGYYSTKGSAAPIPCPNGTYNQEYEKSKCLPCPEGTYCMNESTIVYKNCPIGSYCPTGTTVPTRCPKGTFGETPNLVNASQCTSCTPGSYCDETGMTGVKGDCSAGYVCYGGNSKQNPANSPCPAGHYCLQGTGASGQPPTPCPLGTFNPDTLSIDISFCRSCLPGKYCNGTGLTAPSGNCEAGYYCNNGSTTPTPQDGVQGERCPVGHYCPAGSQNYTQCPMGTFTDVRKQASCFPCTAGFYCPGGNQRLSCPAGYYCPQGSNNTNPCPIGTSSNITELQGVSQCVGCPPGKYCPDMGMSNPEGFCHAGFVCVGENVSPIGGSGCNGNTSHECPVGHYCPEGTGAPLACPSGTYSNSTQNRGLYNCTQCTAGMHCTGSALIEPVGFCDRGYVCRSGSTTSTPTNGQDGYICPKGAFCVEGSVIEANCSAGTYSNQLGQWRCDPCPAGYFCPEGTTNPYDNECPAGWYCEQNTTSAIQYPCPLGTYGNYSGLADVSQCTPCPPGSYCETTGSAVPTGLCTAGWYCPGSSTNSTDQECQPGSYCPAGSAQSTKCDPGYFCPAPRMTQLNDHYLCSSGYFCNGSETSSIANACPAGYFCKNGTHFPSACPAGTYRATPLGTQRSDCLDCDAGYYCPSSASTSPNDNICPQGSYCPSGSANYDLMCDPGYACPTGSGAQNPCKPGSYQPAAGKGGCIACPEGYSCNATASVSFDICPPGSFCPFNTTYSNQFLCPAGTYNNGTGLSNKTECSICPGGKYCLGKGNTKPTGKCAAGYYCVAGAKTATPVDGVNRTGDICPTNNYCPEGSTAPTPCPTGTFASGNGSTNVTFCDPCPVGQYCVSSDSVLLCDEGYVCTGGSVTAKPDGDGGYLCTAGHYCPSGTPAPLQCPVGTFNPDLARGSCYACIEGFYCPSMGMTNATECPKGYYCPSNSSLPESCPNGTYSTLTRLTAASECTKCDTGEYCNGLHLNRTSGPCAAGYFCDRGASSVRPGYTTGTDNGPCPTGHFCLEGTTNPTNCPISTFNEFVGLQNASQCQPCRPGEYCATAGLSNSTGPCKAGYYCPEGSSVQDHTICPKGYHCPTGSANPVGCANSTYMDEEGFAECFVCPAGYYCNNNATVPELCPFEYYCPEGSAVPSYCPPGRYATNDGLSNFTDCALCPNGSYCLNGQIVSNCTAGYLCIEGNDSPTPNTGVYPWPNGAGGGPCPPGFYCPAGTELEVPCDEGTVIVVSGGRSQADCGPCPAGYICDGVVARLCTPGWYCLGGSLDPSKCPIGTYNPKSGATNDTWCLPCEPGYDCKFQNMSGFANSPCKVSHYCPLGTTEPQRCPDGTYFNSTGAAEVEDCGTCPAGSYCAAGSLPVNCEGGTYCPRGSSEPIPCPLGHYCPPRSGSYFECGAGYYCPANSTTVTLCEEGYYCPALSETHFLCPLGMASNPAATLRTDIASSCIVCPAGTHGADTYRQECKPCTAGYVCLGNTTSAFPTEVFRDHGYICPVGHYCPAGDAPRGDVGNFRELACPEGTFRESEGASNKTDCLECEANAYNELTGQKFCKPCGSSAKSDPGSITCTCRGKFRSFQPSDGSCICSPGYEYFDDTNQPFAGDSRVACQPIVYQDCASGEFRNEKGFCVASVRDCNDTCAGVASASLTNPAVTANDGVFDTSVGVCVCAQVPMDDMCNGRCRNNAAKLSLSSTDSNGFAVYDPVNDVLQSLPFHKVRGFEGKLKCNRLDCDVVSVVHSNAGTTGVYGILPALANDLDVTLAVTNSSQGLSAGLQSIDSHGREVVNFGARFRQDVLSDARFMRLQELQHQVRQRSLLSKSNSMNGRGRQEGGAFSGEGLSDADYREFRRLAVDLYAESLPGYTNPTLCIRAGDSVAFQISPQHYPIYAKDSFLNSNPEFDYGEFRQLETFIAANSRTINVFGFTFIDAGVYVFEDSGDSSKTTIISVVDEDLSCNTESAVLATDATNMVLAGVRKRENTQIEPDVLVVLILVIVFFVFSFVIGVFARLKQFRALRIEMEGADHTAELKQKFADIYVQLKTQGATNQKLFDEQGKNFHTQISRILAETAQIKALISVKMSSGKGFIEAASKLLTMEVVARESHDERQGRREKKVSDDISDFMFALEEDTELTDNVLSAVEDVLNSVSGVVESAEFERLRRERLNENASIIGDDVVAILTANQLAEHEAEDVLLSQLTVFKDVASTYKENITRAKEALNKKLNSKQYNAMAHDVAKEQHHAIVRSFNEEMMKHVERLEGSLGDKLDGLSEEREVSQQNAEEASELLEKRRIEVEKRIKTGLFEDLDEDLAEAVRFFLGDAYRRLNPDGSVVQPGDQGKALGAAAVAYDTTDLLPVLMLADLNNNRSDDKKLAQEADAALRGILNGAADMSEEELKRKLDDYYNKQAQTERLMRAEKLRQDEEFLKRIEDAKKKAVSDLTDEEQQRLDRARELMLNLYKTEADEEDWEVKQIKDREKQLMQEELDNLKSIEENIQKQMDEAREEMEEALRNATSPEEEAQIRETYDLNMGALGEELRQARVASQKKLTKIHLDTKRELEALRQRLANEHAIKEEKAKKEAEALVANISATKSDDLGLDRAKLKAAIDGSGQELGAKQKAQNEFHRNALAELTKQQQAEARRLFEQENKQMQQELAKFDEDREDVWQRLMDRKAQDLAADFSHLGAEEALKKKNEALAAYERQLKAQDARDRAALEKQLAQRRRNHMMKLKGDHSKAMQKEMEEQRLEREKMERKMKLKREEEQLQGLVDGENKAKDKHMIEEVLGMRHEEEQLRLLRANHRDLNNRMQDELNDQWDALEEKKRVLLAKRNAGEITMDEYVKLMAELEPVDEQAVRDKVRKDFARESERRLKDLADQQGQEVRDLFKKFYPDEDFSGVEWSVGGIDIDALANDIEKRKQEQKERYELAKKELEEKELKMREDLKAEKVRRLAEIQAEKDAEMEAEKKEKEDEMKKKLELKAKIFEKQTAKKADLLRRRLENETDPAERAKLQAQIDALEQKEKEMMDNERKKQEEAYAKVVQAKMLKARHAALKQAQKEENERKADMKKQKKIEEEKLRRIAHEHEINVRDLTLEAVQRFETAGALRQKMLTEGVALALRKLRRNYRKKAIAFKSQMALFAPGQMLTNAQGETIGEVGAMGGGVGMVSGQRTDKEGFINKIEEMENLLKNMMKKDDGQFNTDGKRYFAPGEDKLKCTGLAVCQESQLSAKQFVQYRFAHWVANFLCRQNNVPAMRLLFATNVPPKRPAFRYDTNAFRNSFHYDKSDRTVYIRLERTQDVGQMILCVVHTVSHALCGEWQDTHSRFNKLFFHNLQYICAELFFSRSAKQKALHRSGSNNNNNDHKANNSSNNQEGALDFSEFRKAFDMAEEREFRENLVQEYIGISGVNSYSDPTFSKDQLFARLSKYKAFANSARMRAHLNTIEQKVTSTEARQAVTSGDHKQRVSHYSTEEKLRAMVSNINNEMDVLNEELLSTVLRIHKVSQKLSAASGKQEHEFKVQLKQLASVKENLALRIASVEQRAKAIHEKLTIKGKKK